MVRTHLQPFVEGDRVRVVTGPHQGKLGTFVRYSGDRCLVRSDTTDNRLPFLPDQLVLVSVSDQCSEKIQPVENSSTDAPIVSDQCSETPASYAAIAIDSAVSVSDQCSETLAIASGNPSDQCSEKTQALRYHLTAAIALLQDLGVMSGWIDPDVKKNQARYPRIRWRDDGVIHSRTLAEWERADVGDRVRRGRLLKQIHHFLKDE